MVERLEEEFAELVRRPTHVIAMNNGTVTLVAALEALQLQPGDEVVTSPFTFVATLNADPGGRRDRPLRRHRPDDFALDPESVEAVGHRRARAVMPVHLYGQPADMARARCRSPSGTGWRVVEDAAQAHGATHRRPRGRLVRRRLFSLYATKNLTTGEGGLVTHRRRRLADRLRCCATRACAPRYEYEMAGPQLPA